MTYAGFKELLTAVLFSDTKVPPDDKILIPMVMIELRAIAYLCEPLALTTRNPDFRIIRDLGDDEYLREANLIQDNESKIDLDKELIDALAFMVAAKISKRKEDDYGDKATEVIASFNFKILEARSYD